MVLFDKIELLAAIVKASKNRNFLVLNFPFHNFLIIITHRIMLNILLSYSQHTLHHYRQHILIMELLSNHMMGSKPISETVLI